jgi:D-alanyl-lipoteichoic acid acyltransferase DltB (MBOAT superfamily)
MIRMIVYLYDVDHMKGPPKLNDFLSYFYLLPNYFFLLFPVVDFQTFRKSYFKRNINEIAQQGVWWIVRGTTHLLLYQLVYAKQAYFSAGHLPVAVAVLGKIFLNYLLYLKISGQFHISVGMLHLFGYDLPETNHKYLLANGISDMWRRINIYWKDFMVKVIYLPTYFKLRKSGEFRAQLVATALVFPVTWFLHAWLFFWIQGKVRVGLNDALFWTILGSVVVADAWRQRYRTKGPAETGWKVQVKNGLQILATYVFISILWSMWSASSLTAWLLFLKTGNAY